MHLLFDQGTPAPLRKALLTTDRNLKYQQNLSQRRIAVVVLLSTSWPRIQRHLPKIVDAIDSLTVGAYIEITVD